MPVQEPETEGFKKWKDGIDKANADWDSYDCEIKTAVSEYNNHLNGKAKYITLDWQLIKAMLWVETGASKPEWKTKPMQIGVPGDKGLGAFFAKRGEKAYEGGDLILPPAWKGKLTENSVCTIPAHNIRAGIGYLLMRMAYSEDQSVPAANSKVYEVIVKSGDSLSRIAKAQGSTVDMLKELNPEAAKPGAILRIGQKLQCRKASIQRVITGWRTISSESIKQRYNGNADPSYDKKLDYVLPLIRKGK